MGAVRARYRAVEASAPSRTIERGVAGTAQLAHVRVTKDEDHLTLCRKSETYERQGKASVARVGRMGWCSQIAAQAPAHRAGERCNLWKKAQRRRYAHTG